MDQNTKDMDNSEDPKPQIRERQLATIQYCEKTYHSNNYEFLLF